MICPQCQSENSTVVAFCDQCGTQLEAPCPRCGEPNRQGAKFCRRCGQAIGETPVRSSPLNVGTPAPDTYVPKHLAEKILASRHKLEGERKQVTVLFADIRGSTTLVEGLDPEEAQKLIDPVLQIMMDAVHKYEGTVNQVAGDGIMALFGAPLAHEDHALRACYAALALQEEMRRYRQTLGQSEESGLQIGVGMNSGEVVLRSIDIDINIEYTAIGHTTHLAARMQELAGPGIVLMSSTTLRQVEGFVQVESLGPVQAKGISQPFEAYSLIGTTSARTRFQAGVRRGLTPLVGRNAEIDIFNKLVEQTAARHGHILAMVGEPGMGKSRLVHEFTRHQLPAGWLVLEGASVSYGKATPYFPLIEMLRRYFQITAENGPEEIQERVVNHVLELSNMLKDTIPPILSLLGAFPEESYSAASGEHNWLAQHQDLLEMVNRFGAMDPQQRRRRTLDAAKRVLIRESQRQPLLIVFEDLHWIDGETQVFLDGFIESLPMSRILLLVDYRPEYSHGWSDRSFYSHLRVDPLNPTNAEELLQHLLGRNKDLLPLKQLLAERTVGNPFFAEESVRSLVEEGVLLGEKGAYRPGLRIDEIRLPSTVQSVVADRIDRLSQEEKRVLQTSAVIGVIVPYALLQAAAEADGEDLQRHLSRLQTAEFLYESNLFPELEYSFRHAITCEVAYGELIHDRRTYLHRRVVQALESKNQPLSHDHVEKLAHHAFCGEIWDKAVNYLKEAGDTALSRSSFRNAVLHFERALEALRHLPESSVNLTRGIDLRFDARNALFLLNEFKRGFEYLEEAKEIAKTLNDHQRLGKLFTWMTAYWNLMGKSEQAVIAGKQALEHTVGPRNIESNIVAHYFLGIAYNNLGQFELSIAELNKALSLIPKDRKFDLFGTTGILSVLCKIWLIRGLAQVGHFSETLQYGEDAIQTAVERDHPFSIVYAYYAVGAVAVIKGDFDQAIAPLERGLRVCESAEIPVQRPLIVSCLAVAYAFVGRIAEAIRLLDSTTERNFWVKETGSRQVPLGKAMSMVWAVETYVLAGQHSEAEALARQGLAVFGESKDRASEAWLKYLIGEILACRDSSLSTQAEASYREASSIAQELGMRPLQAHCYLGLGQLHAQCKNSSAAQSELHAASEFYRAMCMPFWLSRADVGLGAIS